VKRIGLYPRVHADTSGAGVVSQGGGVALVETVRVAGLDRALSMALARWRKPLARHDPAKVITDLAIALAVGGDCLADVALLRAEPAVFGAVASDPTVSRTIDALAADPKRALAAIEAARSAARARVWMLAGEHAPDHGIAADQPLLIDTDATLVTAHSDKEQAAPTFKRGFGFHPLWAFVDHGADGTGEPLSFLLRKGNAGSNTAADHIAVVKAAVAQLPGHRSRAQPGRKILIRVDGAGCTHEFLNWLVSQRLSYSVGFTLPDTFAAAIEKIPEQAWAPAYDAAGEVRDGAWVADVTGLLDLSSWPAGMRVIVRKERPHPGAQLRLTDVDGHRITAFATNTARGQLADLELRHRRRARCEDRIRNAKDTGLTNLPLHDFTQNQIWCAIVTLAVELTAWMQMLTLAGHDARRWEPKRLRLRLFSIAGRLADHGRQRHLHLSGHAPWATLLANIINTLQSLPAPG
jgi:Transposase DDE domain group 1